MGREGVSNRLQDTTRSGDGENDCLQGNMFVGIFPTQETDEIAGVKMIEKNR